MLGLIIRYYRNSSFALEFKQSKSKNRKCWIWIISCVLFFSVLYADMWYVCCVPYYAPGMCLQDSEAGAGSVDLSPGCRESRSHQPMSLRHELSAHNQNGFSSSWTASLSIALKKSSYKWHPSVEIIGDGWCGEFLCALQGVPKKGDPCLNGHNGFTRSWHKTKVAFLQNSPYFYP